MAVPVPVYRIDLNNDGDFSDTDEDVTSRVLACEWDRGSNAILSGEAVGTATLTLSNDDGFFTDANMLPGLPVHIYATYSATDYPRFFGRAKKWTPDHGNHTVKVQAYDELRKMSRTDVVVPEAGSGLIRTPRQYRVQALEDFARGNVNLIAHNPSFETDTAGWTQTGTSLTETGSDNAPGGGTSYGAFIANASGQTASVVAREAPAFFDGQVYRFSVYLKVAAGSASWIIGLDTAAGGANVRTVTVTTSWQRFTITYTIAADRTSSAGGIVGWVESLASGTVRIDNAAITRGQGLYGYAATGTGRYPNFVRNGFDNADGWGDLWSNMIANPSMETNATGWSASADAFHNASFSVARSTSSPKFGVGRLDVTGSASGTQGTHYAITGTFKSGVTYSWSLWAMERTGTNSSYLAGIGSQGTPADFASANPGSMTLNTWKEITGAWTPSADRTDAHIWVYGPASHDFSVDGVQVVRGAPAPYSDTGPGGGGTFVSTLDIVASSSAKYGKYLGYMETPATAGAGMAYDFNDLGGYFVAGQPFTLSMWIRPLLSDWAYKVGIGSNAGDSTSDEATTTGTATHDVWNQVTVTWTPSADRTSATARYVTAFLMQTAASARDSSHRIEWQGVRVSPGSSADDFEPAEWSLAANESDDEWADGLLTGSALGVLSTVNGLTLSRHFIRPTMTLPFWQYAVIDRTTFAALTSSETYTDDPSDVNGFDLSGFDIDEDQIRNVVRVSWDAGSEYYSDADSVDDYGPQPAASIDGSAFFQGSTIPDALAAEILTRFRDPHPRPTLIVTNRFPSQLQRELGEVITIDSARLGTTKDYVIVGEKTAIDSSGLVWETKYRLEEFPY